MRRARPHLPPELADWITAGGINPSGLCGNPKNMKLAQQLDRLLADRRGAACRV